MSDPKLFISYCWSTTEHQEWVLRLGTELRENGVDVILDKWDLKEGNDANAFMEKMVTDETLKKVILIIDKKYGEKANARKGGVGTETQIISAEVYESVDQNKFVAVIAERDDDGKAKLPIFYKSRIYIDLSDNDLYGVNFEQLLRWIYDKPLNVKPELGSKPKFLDEENSISLGTGTAFRRAIEAIKNSRPHAHGSLVEYLNLLSEKLDKYRLPPSKGAVDFDEKIIESIEQFLPTRSELIEIFSTVAQYETSKSFEAALHKFFESLIPYLEKPENINAYHDWDWDNFKFIIHESFLICISILIKHERYDLVHNMINQHYYIEKDPNYGQSKMRTHGVFWNNLRSLSYRTQRLNLRRLSLHADLLKERCTESGLSFNHMMQADFLLYICETLKSLREGRGQEWWPETSVYKAFRGGVFEIFLRAESTEYFNKIAPLLGVKTKADLAPLVEAIKANTIYVPKWDFDRINPLEMINYEKLCSRA